MAKLKPQFKEKTFKTTEGFNNWLDKNTYVIISLKDLGQDMQRIYVHKTGEILYCDFNSSIYAGNFIPLDKLVVGQPLYIINGEEHKIYNGLIVESRKIIQIKEKLLC